MVIWHERLRELLLELNLTVARLAAETGIAESHLRNVLIGKKSLSVHYFARIALEMERSARTRGITDLGARLFELYELLAADETFELRREKHSLDGARRAEKRSAHQSKPMKRNRTPAKR